MFEINKTDLSFHINNDNFQKIFITKLLDKYSWDLGMEKLSTYLVEPFFTKIGNILNTFSLNHINTNYLDMSFTKEEAVRLKLNNSVMLGVI